MINKDKVSRVLVYDEKDNLLISTASVSFPRDFFKIKSQDMVMLKGSKFPLIIKGQNISVIFEYKNGSRVKYKTTVDLCTEYQVNFHVGDGMPLEERRRSFKVNVVFNGSVSFYIRDGAVVNFDEILTVEFVNLNIGGAYIHSEFVFEPGDQIMLSFMDGGMDLLAEVLRAQKKMGEDVIDGYGCKFLNVTGQQEEVIAKFIFECQLAERDRLRKLNQV